MTAEVSLRTDPGPRTPYTLPDSLRLNHAAMDATHEAFCDAIEAVISSSDDQVLPAVKALIAHTVEHFEQEAQWMREHQFPALSCHDGEHQRVLAICEEVQRRVEGGDLEIGRVLGRELIPWFDQHAQSMDAVLAHWMNMAAERSQSGQPMPVMDMGCADHGAEGGACGVPTEAAEVAKT